MAACAQQTFTAAVIEKGKKKKGKYISIKIYMFIAEIVIYFTVFSCLGRAAFQSLVRSTEKPDANIFTALFIWLCATRYTIFTCCIFIMYSIKEHFYIEACTSWHI